MANVCGGLALVLQRGKVSISQTPFKMQITSSNCKPIRNPYTLSDESCAYSLDLKCPLLATLDEHGTVDNKFPQ